MNRAGWSKKALSLLSLLGGGSSSLFVGSVSAVVLVCVARLLGLWEGIELQTLDLFLRHRPIEAVDERITVLEITDADLQALGTYPVPDDEMLALLEKLETYEPRVIGLDIFRDLPVINPLRTASDLSREYAGNYAERSHDALLTLLSTSPKIVTIEKILAPPVQAPPGVPWENIGFADALLDSDGFLRRSLLASPSDANPDDYHLSFTIQLAAKYLAAEGLELENGIDDPVAMRFGETELFRMTPNSGGYRSQDTGENPVVLINFRHHPEPFHRISLSQFMADDFSADWIEDRIVLIGMTAVSTKDYINSAALIEPRNDETNRIKSQNPGLVPGVDLQAHAISQILSATLDGRPIFRTWVPHWEYLWIVGNGLVGLSLVYIKRRISTVAVIFIVIGSVPFVLSYSLLMAGVWIPLFPAWVAYAVSGSGMLVYRLHLYEQGRKIRFNERQRVLERSYNAIHNGPLQTLKSLIRQVSSQSLQASALGQSQLTPSQLPPDQLETWLSSLHTVDSELRNIYEFMQREYLQTGYSPSASQIYLTKNYVIDLTEPLHELLHQVYQNRLQESGAYFGTIRIKISDFCPMDAEHLTVAHKESLLRFFEEALCNVEQHAVGATRLKVVCKQTGENNVIRVADNGRHENLSGPEAAVRKGDGSRQAEQLAKRLKGHFARRFDPSKGTVCELIWPIQPPSFWAKQSS